jgi:hypothetical protein
MSSAAMWMRWSSPCPGARKSDPRDLEIFGHPLDQRADLPDVHLVPALRMTRVAGASFSMSSCGRSAAGSGAEESGRPILADLRIIFFIPVCSSLAIKLDSRGPVLSTSAFGFNNIPSTS